MKAFSPSTELPYKSVFMQNIDWRTEIKEICISKNSCIAAVIYKEFVKRWEKQKNMLASAENALASIVFTIIICTFVG